MDNDGITSAFSKNSGGDLQLVKAELLVSDTSSNIFKRERFSPLRLIHNLLLRCWFKQLFVIFFYSPELVQTVQHKTHCLTTYLLKLWLLQIIALCTLSFMCTYPVGHTQYMSKSCLNACRPCPRFWGVILTESQMSRVYTHALLQPPYLFVFSSRCTARPWRAMKVMLVVQRWKCVTGGRLQGPAWNLQSPHRVQDRGPAQEQERRGESKRPVETRCPSTRDFTQILFHSETWAATGRWAGCKLQSGKLSSLLFSAPVQLGSTLFSSTPMQNPACEELDLRMLFDFTTSSELYKASVLLFWSNQTSDDVILKQGSYRSEYNSSHACVKTTWRHSARCCPFSSAT